MTINPKPYFGEFSDSWILTEACVPLMCEAFEKGTHFFIDHNGWEFSIDTGELFEGWRQTINDDKYCIRVSNDERRRLLPILARLKSR